MSIELNFVSVLHALVEPELKLRLSANKPFSDTYSEAKIKLHYDPQISVDQLTMPGSETQNKRWMRHNSTSPPMNIFCFGAIRRGYVILVKNLSYNGTYNIEIFCW